MRSDSTIGSVKPVRAIIVRIVLVSPPVGVDYGIQRGNGSKYETLFTQRPSNPRAQIVFDVPITVTDTRPDGLPNFTGPLVQGPPAERFVYVDIGKYAGQRNTAWARRMKVPLGGIHWTLIEQAAKTGRAIETRIPGTAKDGSPTAASTAKLQSVWVLVAR
jgi:hypothetical protein